MNQTHYAICTLTMLFEAVVLFLIAIFCSIGERVTWILWFKDTLCIGQIEASTSTPRANPREFDFFENFCSNFPLPGPKCRSNAPQ